MRKFVLFFVQVAFLFHVSAQSPAIDSLYKLLQQHVMPDSARLSLLNKIAFEESTGNTKKGTSYANEAIQLANKLDNKSALAEAYLNLGKNEHRAANDSLALQHYNTAVELFEKQNEWNGVAKTYYNIGIFYSDKGDYTDALNWQNRALHIFDSTGEMKKKCQVLNSMGVVHMYLSDYKGALDLYLKAVHISDSLHYDDELAALYANIGLNYSHLNEAQKALDYHKRSLELHKKLGNLQGIAYQYNNIGNIYDDMDDSTQALRSYRDALEINKKIGNKWAIASNLANIGIVNKYYGLYNSGETYLDSALDMYLTLGDKYNISLLKESLAEIYLEAPQQLLLQKGSHISTAYAYAASALLFAQQTGSLERQLNVWYTLSRVYEKQNRPAEALNAYKKYVALKDSAFNDENKEAITRREMQFEYQKKEAVDKAEAANRQALAESEINRQRLIRNVSIGAGLLVLFGGAFFLVLYKRRRDAEAKRIDAEFNAQVADTEMKALRAQMNPHFIFNSLNSISDYISKNDTEAAEAYLSKFARIMRMILEHSEVKEVALAEDLKALELYMQLECVRLKHSFTYEIIVDPEIDPDNTLIPPLILQPFVENSIWHGLSGKKEPGKITIRINKSANMLNCVVEDNGVGRSNTAKQSMQERTSMGMKITKERIDIIRKTKQTEAAVSLTDLQQGTKVEVTLPLETSF